MIERKLFPLSLRNVRGSRHSGFVCAIDGAEIEGSAIRRVEFEAHAETRARALELALEAGRKWVAEA